MRVLLAAALGLLLCSTARADASVLLVDSPFDDGSGRPPTRVYTVDLGSGALTLAADLGDAYTPALALAAASRSVLYAIGSDNGANPCFSCLLLRVVLAPPSTTPVSITPIGKVTSNGIQVIDFTGMSFRGNGELYAVSESTDRLYRIDPTTAVATDLGAITVDSGGGCSTTVLDVTGGDLAFDFLDRLWLWNNTQGSRGLWEVNPSNACAVSSAACPSSRNLTGLVVDDHASTDPTLRGASPQDDRIYATSPGVCPVNGQSGSVPLSLGGQPFHHSRGDADSPYCEDDASCDDADACTSDVCSPGGCRHTGVTCDDGDPCTEDACDAGTGGCVFVPRAVSEVTGVALQKGAGGATQLSWVSQGADLTYDLVRGSISGRIASAACLQSDLTGTQATDSTANPPVNAGFFYLVRAAGTCGNGSYGASSAGQERQPPSDCP